MRTEPFVSRSLVTSSVRWLAAPLAALLFFAGCSSTSSDGSAAPSKETFCGLLVAFRASNDSLDADITSADPAALRSAITRLVSQAKALEKRAPEDIEPDVARVSVFIDELDSLFAGYDYDMAKLSADPAATEKYATINDDESQAALDQLRAYGDIDCAELTTTTSAAGPASSPTSSIESTVATTIVTSSTVATETTVAATSTTP